MEVLSGRIVRSDRDGRSAILSAVVALDDVADVEGFVRATLQRFERDSQFTLEHEEREDLVLEGIAILYELAERFEPHRAGYENPGRFSGYAAWMLPKRLGEAWHRAHPEHRYVTGPDGKRRWEYLLGTVSLEEQTTRHSDVGDAGERDESHFLCPSKWVPVPVAA